MAKNVDHIQHIKSNVVLEGKPKLPESSALIEGELAINYANGVETISIKNSDGNIVTFSSDDYYSSQKLGSAFTGANSAVTVTDALENIHIDVDQVLDDSVSASTNPISSQAVYSAITDNELVWTNAYVAISGAVSSHTVDTNMHITSADRVKIDSIDSLSGTVTAHTADTDIHLTSTEKTQLHTHSNKSYLDAISGNLGTMAYENASSYSSATQVNTALGDKANTSDIADFFDDAKYEDSGTSKVINFYHGNTVKATINADDFIKDGMIDTVSVETSGSTSVLVITWNTDAGKSQTILDIGDLFEADNYYTKSQTSGATELANAFNATLSSGDVITVITPLNSGSTAPVSVSIVAENEHIVASALADLDANKLDASAYTPVDLTNYYTKSETSGSTEISNALGGKVDSATFTTFSGSTESSITDLSGQTETIAAALVELHSEIGDIEALLATI